MTDIYGCLDLIYRYEAGEAMDMEEYDHLADFVWATRLHRSTGSWGRFIRDMAENGWTPKEEA